MSPIRNPQSTEIGPLADTDIHPGMRVKVTQTVEHRDGPWATHVEGTILSVEPHTTGAWFAHGKKEKYWLVRIKLEKDDGELTDLILDRNTRITVVDGGR